MVNCVFITPPENRARLRPVKISPYTPPPQKRNPAAGAFAGGVTLGAPAAVLGYQLGERYGMRLVQAAVPHALELIQKGWVSPKTALDLARYALRPVVQAQVGALVLGTVGIAVGCFAGAALFQARG